VEGVAFVAGGGAAALAGVDGVTGSVEEAGAGTTVEIEGAGRLGAGCGWQAANRTAARRHVRETGEALGRAWLAMVTSVG
jgi:hypothetical protein